MAAPINSRLNVVVRSPTPFRLGQNGCWSSRGSQLPRALPSYDHFFAMLSPEQPQKSSTQLFKNRSPVFSLLLPLSCPSSSPHSSPTLDERKVYPNPGPIFPCSVCAGNVTRRGRSVQCCTCSKWVHLRCSLLFFSQFRTLGSSPSWSCPLLRSCFF